MQETVGWPSDSDIPEPVARVLVDGQEVEVQSVEIASEIDSAMPDRVAAGGGGVVAATGTVTFLPHDDLLGSVGNPWGNAIHYVEANSVVVDAGYRDYISGETHSVRQVTGHVESLAGSALSHGIDLEVVDYTPLLDRNITIEPLLQEYPSLEDWGPRRGAGLSPMYITDRVLRHCGFYATPPMIPQALVSAPMMGSVAPERGVLYAATAQSDTAASAAFRPTAWGMGLGNGVVSYRPNYGSRGHGRRTSTLHISFLRERYRNSSPQESRIDLQWGSFDNAICVYLRADDTLMLQYRNRGVPTDVATLDAS